MKNCLFFLIISFFLNYSAFSQARIELVGGIHTSTVIEKNNVPGFDEFKKGYSNRTGGHFGVIADLPINGSHRFSFQPGVIFQNKGRKYFNIDTSTSPVQSLTYNQLVNYVDLPLNLVVKFPLSAKTKFIIGAGPYLSAFYTGKENTETFYKNGDFVEEKNEDLPVGNGEGKYAVFNYGVGVLAGLEFGRVMLTANASQGLNDFYRSSDHDGSFKHRGMGATLGIFLGQKPLPPAPKDKDKDGIPDTEDACPEEPGLPVTNGCPDRDGDGIADKDDKCPDEAGFKKYLGCPVPDSDKDNINDEEDQCPDIPGLIKYNGCPIPDGDKDGINDELDECPEIPGFAKYNGCPVPDSDNDGINDMEDNCPQVAGVKENNGCPPVAKEITEKINKAARQIQFTVNKAELTTASFKVLDEVIDVLNQDKALKLTIEGHTSSDGNVLTNQKLSEQRANAVKTYLISKNIDINRITTIGYGASKPLNDGKTPEERNLNRRVELKLSN